MAGVTVARFPLFSEEENPETAGEDVGSRTEFIHPIQPPHFSGSFGEYRKHSRYHHGLDYKTFARVGIPVLMPRDGVVRRFKSSDRGYGNALWVESGDIRFTFGHLLDFLGDRPGLEYFRASLDLLLPRKAFAYRIPPYFRFKQGEVLARSGESGSGAPHLHFEVLRGGYYYDPLHLPGMAADDTTAPELLNVYLETGRSVLKFALKKVVDEPGPGPGTNDDKTIPGPGSVHVRYVLADHEELTLPRGNSVRFMMGGYDTMLASNRNGVSDLRLFAGERKLYSRSLARIAGRDLGGASRVYHTARTVIGSEYVFILYGDGRGRVDRGRADADGRVPVRIEIADSMGNTAELNFPIHFTGEDIPAAYLTGASAAERGAFRGVGEGSSVSRKHQGARLVLNFGERSLFGGGRIRVAGLPEAEIPDEIVTKLDAAGNAYSERLDPFYRREGPAFIVETQDLFYKNGAEGSAVFPAPLEGIGGLYYYNNTVKRWLLLARPYATRDGKNYYSFRFRREGPITQLVDLYAPRIGSGLLWDDPPLTDENRNIIREYTVRDRGSGIQLDRIEVLFDGRVYPHEWIKDRSIIRVIVPADLVGRRGAVLSLRVVDYAENYSPWFFDCLDPIAPSS